MFKQWITNMINSRIGPSILFLSQTQNTVMQQYSFYIMPLVPCSPSLFTLNTSFAATNAAHGVNGQAFMAGLYANHQPLHQSAPHSAQHQQSPPLLTCPNPARPSRAPQHRIESNVRKKVLNKNLVQDHNVYKYPKKNAQSNLINQVISYLCIQSKSLQPLLAIFKGNQDKAHLFFTLMRQVKRQSKKYINRGFLKDLLMIQKSHIIHGILQKNKIAPLLTLQELQSALRRIVFHFLLQKSAMTVLTSSKLDRFSMKEHLQRRREVIEYLRYHLNHPGEEEQSNS